MSAAACRRCRSAARSRSGCGGRVSPSSPVISACSGAWKVSAPCRDVVHLAVGDHDGAGDARGRHVAEGAVERAEEARLGAFVGALGLAGLDHAHLELREAGRAAAAGRRAPALVSAWRSPMSWLWLRSTTRATTLFSGSRSSSSSTGLTSAAASATRAAKRNQAPRWRKNRPASASSAIGTRTAASQVHDRSGSKATDQFIYCPSLSSRTGTCTWSDL